MLRRALASLLVLGLLGGPATVASVPAATTPKKKTRECRKPIGKDERKRCGAAGRRAFRGLGSTGRYILGGVVLAGTFSSLREEDGRRYEASGTMTYKATPTTRADLDRMGDIRKPWDWDLDGWGFEPLPAKAVTDEFDRLLVDGDPHPTLPIDIDHRWTDGAGTHRITWWGHIGLVSLDLVMDHRCRSLCAPADLDDLEKLAD